MARRVVSPAEKNSRADLRFAVQVKSPPAPIAPCQETIPAGQPEYGTRAPPATDTSEGVVTNFQLEVGGVPECTNTPAFADKSEGEGPTGERSVINYQK